MAKLNFDTRHLPRSIYDWDRLVTALGEVTDDTIESTYLELKGPLDLSASEHKFKVSRAILSFSNRDPDAAAPFLDGHALVVIGVAAGAVSGTARIEDHQLINAFKPYLGDAERSPRWTVHRHRIDDANDVLIIDIDAPKPGDPIYTLQKGFGNQQPGTIFTRPSTESVPADPAGIEMLSRRVVGRVRDFQIDFALNQDAIARYTWDPAVLDAVLNWELRNYLRKPPRATSRRPNTPLGDAFRASSAIESIARSQAAFTPRGLGKHHGENRSEEEFQAELEDWAEQVRESFQNVVLDLLAIALPPARFTVTNTCGRFLEGLELEVHIEGPVIQHPRPHSNRLRDLAERLPARPRKWGPWNEPPPDYSGYLTAANYTRPILPPRPNSTDFRNGGSVTATLHCAELRPGRTHTFTPDQDDHTDIVLLTTERDMESTRITVKATARSIDDEYFIEFTQPVGDLIDMTSRIQQVIPHLNYFAGPPAQEPE